MISDISRVLRKCSLVKLVFREMSSMRVKVSQGVVRGCEEELPDGRSYLRFSGVPYAKPPLGDLRFKSPQKLLKFNQDEIDCTKERDACFHKSTLNKQYVGSEDCLNLNVYVPKKPYQEGKKFAVMVYIHGGGFKYDSNSKELYSPEYLLMEDVIVVVINYRQHVLGFLWMPSVGISGNTGLKDQQMALQWVHENISSFNGDPNNICLFGESGGAGSVHYQVMNPKSRQYISSAILQSGSVINEWSFFGQTEETAKYLAKLLGGSGETAKSSLDTLMAAPVRELYDKCEKVLKPEEIEAGIRYKWRLVIEEESDDAFITKTSIESMVSQAGQINFPMILGTNNGDGMPNVASAIARKRLGVVNKNFHYNLPRLLPYKSKEAAMQLSDEIKKFYFNGRDLSEDTIEEFLKLRTDMDYLVAQTVATELNARYNPGCTQYLYEFQFDGRLNLQKQQMKLGHLPVAGHADDVFYLFGGILSNQVKIEEGSREDKMRKLMCKLWTNFAKYHNPTPDHDNPLPFKWTPLKPVEPNANKIDLDYLVINDEMKIVQNLNKDRMDFWRGVYRKNCEDFRRAKL